MRIGCNDREVFQIIFGTRAPEAAVCSGSIRGSEAEKISDTKRYVPKIDRHSCELLVAATYRDVPELVGRKTLHSGRDLNLCLKYDFTREKQD